MTERGRVLADIGDRSAVAPGRAVIAGHGRRPNRTITISELTAAQYAVQLRGLGFGLVVRQGGRTLASSPPAAPAHRLPSSGRLAVGATTSQVVTLASPGSGQLRSR